MIPPTATPLPPMGLGMAALGRPGYITLDRTSILGDPTARSVESMQTRANLVMDHLCTLSSKTPNMKPWLDCARSYGLSESFVGSYLRSHKIPPSDVYVSSKWGYTYVADWHVSLAPNQPHEIKDHSVSNFLKQLEETSEHLGEYVDLYQVHSATFDSGILENQEVHKALHRCREEKGWKLGLSVSGPQQGEILQQAMSIRVPCSQNDNDKQEEAAETEPLFNAVQCTFNLLEQAPLPFLMKAHQSGMDIIVKEGLANGRLLRHPKLLEFSKKLDCTPDALALGCILAQDFEPRVLSGAVTAEQLEGNWGAMEVALKFKEEKSVLLEIMEACVVESEAYWKERATLSWN